MTEHVYYGVKLTRDGQEVETGRVRDDHLLEWVIWAVLALSLEAEQ